MYKGGLKADYYVYRILSYIIRDLCTAYIDRGIGCIDRDHHRHIFLKNVADVKEMAPTFYFRFSAI